MNAPKYIHRDANTESSEAIYYAIRFLQGDPKTHWYVNYGHPRIKLLEDRYWVATRKGPDDIYDGQWVVYNEGGGLTVWDNDHFFKTFKPLSDYE